MAKVSLIAAVDRRGGIGYQNRLLYWLPNDLKRFKALTTGHTIVMGRRTFESLPKGALPNRRNIVLSRQAEATFPGAEHFTSLQEVLAHCAQEEEVFIIGGASLYADAIALADALYLTEVDDASQPADAFFPPVNAAEWKEKGRDARPVDEKHLYPYAFVDYERVR
jgi:dihydrofolate reductase